ncbi:hypothetical protein SAMN04487948_101479 [Halogranum amylolyticum]|uniref:Uncharacterized protein n=1 Tax=Halogranum amylolyticum TaxID=660520 RepID=A0A1H8NDZ5_9EURY|nr:hypothetical protein [Halogranum amylolyticum]SEO27689.1 hypothetical protein SAMN04487948_101479 [Halogranum amylolyticum]
MPTIQRSQLAALVLSALLLVGSIGGVAAQDASADDSDPEWEDTLFTELSSMVDDYNAHAGDVDLGPISLGGATNVYVIDGDERASYTLTMDRNHRITDVQQGTDSDPAAAFRSAVANGDVVVAGESGQFVEQVKWTVVNVLKGFLL